jgi:sugar phosphate isomerase/epimerase|tara:strand:+ start:696 stop:1598 length:903 start_codon:yes stop_codon:yes gene_type:complete
MANRNIKLGYSTFAMPKVDAFKAISMVSSIGYDAIEFCVMDQPITSSGDTWQTNLNAVTKSWKEIKNLAQSEGLMAPVLFDLFSVCAETSNRGKAMDRVKRTCELAANLNYDRDHGLVVTQLGKPEPELSWGISTLLKNQKIPVIDGLNEVGDIASQFNVVIGIEAHINQLIDTPEKVVWAITQTNHNSIKIDFDISHFICQGIDLQHSVDLCAPHTALIHVKDGYMLDDPSIEPVNNNNVVFQLPGEGNLDLTQYLDSITEAGLTHLPVFAEVSMQLSRLKNYDELKTAVDCYKYLSQA